MQRGSLISMAHGGSLRLSCALGGLNLCVAYNQSESHHNSESQTRPCYGIKTPILERKTLYP